MLKLRPRDAAFCFVECGGLFLVAKRSSTAKNRPNEWDLPGGKIDEGETTEEGMLREVREEVGIELESLTPASTVRHPNGGRKYFYFTSQTKTKEVKLSYEHNEYKWVAKEELPSLLDHPPHKKAASSLV